jgi:hypothetical protein
MTPPWTFEIVHALLDNLDALERALSEARRTLEQASLLIREFFQTHLCDHRHTTERREHEVYDRSYNYTICDDCKKWWC